MQTRHAVDIENSQLSHIPMNSNDDQSLGVDGASKQLCGLVNVGDGSSTTNYINLDGM